MACNLVAYFLKACMYVLILILTILTIFFHTTTTCIYVIILNDTLLVNGLLSYQCIAKDNYASSQCAQGVT